MNKHSIERLKRILLLATMTFVLLSTGAASSAELTSDERAIESDVQAVVPRLFLPISLYGKLPPPRTNTIFGTQMYNDSRPQSQFYDSLLDSQASWLRIALNWAYVEPSNVAPENYNWGYADAIMSAARPDTANLNVLGTFETAPAWAVDDPLKYDGPLTATGLAEFVQFVGATVERYDGDGYMDAPGSPIVTHWEFYNEPDRSYATHDGRWGDDGDRYAEMLRQVYPVLKAANPSAQVVMGGLAYDWFTDQGGPFVRSFIDDVLAAGGGDYFDIFNFHTYPLFASNWVTGSGAPGPGLLQKADYLRDHLAAAGITKPMIVTEAGWHSNNAPNVPLGSPSIQAAYVIQLYAQSFAADIDYMIWWMLYDPGGGGNDNGLVTGDPTPARKLSFYVYRSMVDLMKDAKFVRPLAADELQDPSQEAYLFRRQGRDFYIAWLNPVTASGQKALQIPAQSVTLRDMLGQVSAVVTDNEDGVTDGQVKVVLNATPQYIEVTK